MKVVLLLLFSLFSGLVYSDGTAVYSGKIRQIVVFPEEYLAYDENQKGMVAIYIEGLPKGCDVQEGHRRVIMGVSHPLYNSALSLGLAAKAANLDVTITYFKTCTHRAGSWDLAAFSIE